MTTNPKKQAMIDLLCTRPLLELLRTALERGAINGWAVEGPYVVLYRTKERVEVLPLEAGALLRDLISKYDPNTACA